MGSEMCIRDRKDPVRLAELSRNIEALAIPDSAERIVNEIEKQLPQSK